MAAHTVVWQLWSLVSYGVDGFAHAAEALVGAALGSGLFTRARAISVRVLRWGVAIGLLFAGVYAAGLEYLVGLVDNPYGGRCRRWRSDYGGRDDAAAQCGGFCL